MSRAGERRAERLAALLREQELDALVVTSLVNVHYLTGFTGTNAICVVGVDGLRAFLTDFRYVEQAERQVQGFDRWRGKGDLLPEVCERLAGVDVARVGFEDHDLTVNRHTRFRELLDDETGLVPAGRLVERLRAVKEPDELAAIRVAAGLVGELLAELVDTGVRGRSERELARDIETEMRSRGAEPAFETIVAAGPNSALPHATPGDAPIPPDTLMVVDLGCRLDDYCSDCTRTFATGPLPDDLGAAYELVRAAQERALAAVRPEAGCKAVDGVARAMIDAAGHGDHFGHGLGHGVGLEVHEAPRLTQAAGEDETLAAGNVITVEPGVYLPGRAGVRVEDLVAVGEDGPEILTPFPKELMALEA